jgi:hypothetical protein
MMYYVLHQTIHMTTRLRFSLYPICMAAGLAAVLFSTSCDRVPAPEVKPQATVAPKSPPESVLPTDVASKEPQIQINPEAPFDLKNFVELKTALEQQAKSGETLSSALTEQIIPFLTAWGRQDGLAAVSFCQSLAEAQITSGTMAALRGWAQQDLAAAVKWVIAYETDGHEKTLYLAQLATNLKQQDLEQVPALAAAWSGLDPAGANLWLFGMSPSATRDSSINTSLTQWTKSAPEAVSAFLVSAPKGPARDVAIAAMINVIANDDPAGAEKWRQEISPQQAPNAPQAISTEPANKN